MLLQNLRIFLFLLGSGRMAEMVMSNGGHECLPSYDKQTGRRKVVAVRPPPPRDDDRKSKLVKKYRWILWELAYEISSEILDSFFIGFSLLLRISVNLFESRKSNCIPYSEISFHS